MEQPTPVAVHTVSVESQDECAPNARIDETEQLRALGRDLGLHFVDFDETLPDPTLLEKFPRSAITRCGVLPFRDNGHSVEVATADPFDFDTFSLLAALTGLPLTPVLAGAEAIRRMMNQQLGVASGTVDELINQEREAEEVACDDSGETEEGASVVRLVNQLLSEAAEQGASDVHIEPGDHGLSIRFRVDGLLRSQPVPEEISRFYSPIVTRLKIMAGLNIAEKRRPQDGRIQMRVADRDVDLRVSTIPVVHGEGVVLRLLDRQGRLLGLQEMGLSVELLESMRRLIRQPHGIFLVTGPTGSGKTTTLYSALAEISDESLKVITAEDPVEYEFPGISQIQVQPQVDLTFASSLRSMLRHDPDVILIGEIRDRETAESAIRAALTGHLVFSTLHTNDAAAGYTRLIEMGIPPFLVASSVIGVLAQRLVRRLCTHCRVPAELDASDRDSCAWAPGRCKLCGHSGYAGRTGIFELIQTDDAIRALCLSHASSEEIRKQAAARGHDSMQEDGWAKVRAGVTSRAEVLRVTTQEDA